MDLLQKWLDIGVLEHGLPAEKPSWLAQGWEKASGALKYGLDKTLDVVAGSERVDPYTEAMHSASGYSSAPYRPLENHTLDESSQPYPTLLLEEWLAWSFEEQTRHLVNAWLRMPKSNEIKKVRKKIIDRLLEGAELTHYQQREMLGLQALGICTGNCLTLLGQTALEVGRAGTAGASTIETWQIAKRQLIVPFPPRWELLWQLEKYLDPIEPGVYSLDAESLNLAVRRGALSNDPTLPEILLGGLGCSPPAEILDLLVDVPNIRVIPGYLLEFDQPDTLKKLRRSSSLRREFSGIISPRHIILEWAIGYPLVLRLFRSGFIPESDFAKVRSLHLSAEKTHSGLSASDRAYLIYLLLSKEDAQKQPSTPAGLLSRLSEGVDPLLLAAAAHKAETTPKEMVRPTEVLFENFEPEQPDVELLAAIQSAIYRGDSIDVLYRASGRHMEEQRHLTPLLLEQRGDRYYLIAFCHTRKANRTFRIDRLKWIK